MKPRTKVYLSRLRAGLAADFLAWQFNVVRNTKSPPWAVSAKEARAMNGTPRRPK